MSPFGKSPVRTTEHRETASPGDGFNDRVVAEQGLQQKARSAQDSHLLVPGGIPARSRKSPFVWLSDQESMLAGRPQRHEGRRVRGNQLTSGASYRIPSIDLYVEALAWMRFVGIDEDRGNRSPLTLTSNVTRRTS